jgi:hypothetical protein
MELTIILRYSMKGMLQGTEVRGHIHILLHSSIVHLALTLNCSNYNMNQGAPSPVYEAESYVSIINLLSIMF